MCDTQKFSQTTFGIEDIFGAPQFDRPPKRLVWIRH